MATTESLKRPASPTPLETTEAKRPKLKRGKYYLEDVIFQTEDDLHRVPKAKFEKWSHSVFRDMFQLPQGDEQEGQSDVNPIKLPCTTFEFESLLEVMWGPLDDNAVEMTKEQWVAALSLSKLWDMPKISGSAIKNLNRLGLTPLEKVTYGRKCNVLEWLKSGYAEIAQDPYHPTLTPKELMKVLGAEALANVLWVYGHGARNQLSSRRTVAIENLGCGQCKAKNVVVNRRKTGETFWCAGCATTQATAVLNPTAAYLQSQKEVLLENVATIFKAELDRVAAHDI